MPRRRGTNKKRSSNKKKKDLEEKSREIFSNIENVNDQLLKFGISPVKNFNELISVLTNHFINICDFVRCNINFYSSFMALNSSIKSGKKYPKSLAKKYGLSPLLITTV